MQWFQSQIQSSLKREKKKITDISPLLKEVDLIKSD